jgi:hypothetical protein
MHRGFVVVRSSGLVFAAIVFVSVLVAQFGTENVEDRDVGRPPRAPFITFLGIVAPGKMASDPSLPLNGPVAEVLYEELRAPKTPAGPAGEVVVSIRTKYDQAGRATEETRKERSTETTTINRYQGSRLVSQETTFPKSSRPQPKFWSYWTYDQSGKLIEYRRGSGDVMQNHDSNFKRDGEGRLISFEYRQGAEDELFSRTEFRYSHGGRTIDSTLYDAAGEETRSTTEGLDDKGQVVWVAIRERGRRAKKPGAPVKVAFRYDVKGRLLEQDTDAHNFVAAGGEHELPPGKVSITYDDVKHTKTTTYADGEGLLTSTAGYNSGGAIIAMSNRSHDASFDVRLECAYDEYKNWTACQQTANRSGVNTAEKMWRRTIIYR